MAFSVHPYVGDGSTTQYAVNFTLGYLDKTHVVCTVEGEVDGLGDPIPRTLTWITDNLVDIGVAPALGLQITIRRVTPKSVLVHDYQDGAVMAELSFDESNLQHLMIAHELLDGFVGEYSVRQFDEDMEDFKIVNLADPVDPQDAVTKLYVDATLPALVTAAELAETNAAASETAAALSETNAAASEAAAALSAAMFSYLDEDPATTSTLTWGWKAGQINVDNSIVDVSAGTLLMAAFNVNYVEYSKDSGMQVNQTGFTPGSLPIRILTTLAVITNSIDKRSWITLNTLPVSVDSFGAVGDGVTDDTAAIQAAIDSLGLLGGKILLPKKHLVDSALTVKPNVTLVGVHEFVGSPADNSSAEYGELNGALIISNLVTVTLKGGAGISGLLVYKKGLLFPENTSAAFAGTAFTGGGDDNFIVNSMILGFGKAYYSTGWQRVKIKDVNIDCISGIDIQNCLDISRICDVHCWPFATIAGTNPVDWWKRSGIAYNFDAIGDWNKLNSCFSYGYFKSVAINDCNSMLVVSCGADSFGGYTGQIGFSVTGNSSDTKFIACQAAAQGAGFYFNTTAGLHSKMLSCSSWSCTSRGVLVDGGDISIDGGTHRDEPDSVTVNNAASRVFIDNIRTNNLSNVPVNLVVASSLVFIGDANDYGDLANGASAVGGSALTSETIASADPLNIPPSAKTITVTGVTGIGNVLTGWKDREVTLIFDDILTVFDGGANMSLAGNFVTSAGDTLTLVHDGVIWNEVSRSVN